MENSNGDMFAGFYDTEVSDFIAGCTHGEILWLAKKLCNIKVLVGQPTMTAKVVAWSTTEQARCAHPDIARRAAVVMREVKTHGYDASSRLLDKDAYLVTGNSGWASIQTLTTVPEEFQYENLCDGWLTKCEEGYDLTEEENHALNCEASVESTFYRSMTLDPKPTKDEFVKVKGATIAQDCLRVNEQSGKVVPVVGQACAGVKKQFASMSVGLTAMATRKASDRVYPRHYMYDGMMRDDPRLHAAVARRLALTAPPEWSKYIAKEVDGRYVVTPTMVPAPKVRKFAHPSKVLYMLRPLFSRRGMGHIASSIVDGVPLAPPMRQVVNTLNDIYVPQDATVVYWSTSNKDNVLRLWRRTNRKDIVIFYDGDYLAGDEERKIFKDGKIITSGIIPTKSFRDVNVGKNKVLYIDLSKASATVTKSKVFVDSVSQVAAHDARKMECVAQFAYYIVRVHALALCKEFWEDNAKLPYPQAPFYYVSAQVSSMNVLATNVSREPLGVDALTRDDVVPVYLAVAGLWNQFPVTRVNASEVSYWSDKGERKVRLFPKVQYIPMRKVEKQKELFDGDIDESDGGLDLTFAQAKRKTAAAERDQAPVVAPLPDANIVEEEDEALAGLEF